MKPIAEWISAEIDAGRDDLQTMLDSSPYSRPAVRTIAEAGSFAIADGRVVYSDGPSWFVADSPLRVLSDDTYGLDVEVVDPADSLAMPLALVSMLGVPRGGRAVLSSDQGTKLLWFTREAKLGPIGELVDDRPGRYTLIFDPGEMRLSVSAR